MERLEAKYRTLKLMRKITFYITRRLAFATLFITIILTAAVWLTQSLRFVNLVVGKGLTMTTFLHLTSLLLPNLLTLVLPAALLMALLFTYNRLIADNELVVMRGVGMSPRQLLNPALQITTLIMVILYMINFYLLPWSLHTLREVEYEIRNQMSISMLQSGQFNTFHNLTIYVNRITPEGEVYGVIIHNARPHEKAFTITAKKGEVIKNKGETRLVLIDGVRHDEPHGTKSPTSINFEQYVVDLTEESLTPEKREKRKPYEYTTWELLNPDPSMGKESTYFKFIAQGHQRIIGPLHALVFTLITLTVLLAGDFNRRGHTKKNIIAASLCILVQISSLTFLNLAEKLPFMIFISYFFLGSLIMILLLHFYEKIDLDAIFGETLS